MSSPGAGRPWFEQLEAQLEQQLEAFLRAHPAQEALLQEQEQQERQGRLRRQRLELQQQAEQQRTSLLQLARDIDQWQQRVERARQGHANDLAERAEAHVQLLMAQGRDRWQALTELGDRFRQLDSALEQLAQQRPPAAAQAPCHPDDLNQAWAAFEAEQELEQLKRRQP
jgi:hercynine metabolism protein